MSKNRRWVFTLNNPTQEEKDAVALFLESQVYGIVANEVGESGTPHLQGFVILPAPQRLSYLRNNLSARAHYEVAKGTSKQASDYCEKDHDFTKFGTLPAEQGKRSDLDRFYAWIADQSCKPSQREIAQQFPSLFLRYPRLTELIDHLLPQPELAVGDLREWQFNLDEFLDSEPDDRSISFIVDEEGGIGKSFFVRYELTKRPDDVQFLSVGKRDDLAYAIDETKSIFLFDIPRGSMEHFQYSILEKLKDQLVFSAKYASRVKVLPKPVHVVVFCNERPEMIMTHDRYKIHDTHDTSTHEEDVSPDE